MKNINLNDLFIRKKQTTNLEPTVAWPVHFLRDWKILVLIFAIGLISLSLFSWKIYLSNQIGGGYLPTEDVSSDTSVRIINQKKLQTNVLILENKQAEYLKQKNNQTKPVDPSL
jgi:hypothetical protein